MDITFYHLTKFPIVRALPQLITKISELGERAFILCKDEKQMLELDQLLWTMPSNAFIPHDTIKCSDPKAQPLLLLTEIKENLNNAKIAINLTASQINENLNLKKYLYVFYGNEDEPEVVATLNLYESYRGKDHKVNFWKQDVQSKWIKQ
jgi:DNA polymerase III subunit chi